MDYNKQCKENQAFFSLFFTFSKRVNLLWRKGKGYTISCFEKRYVLLYSVFRTDLAVEAYDRLGGEASALSGVTVRRETLFDLPLCAVEIRDEEAAERLGKGIGHYYTLELPASLTRFAPHFSAPAAAVAALIRRCGVPKEGGVLVAALGNPDITPDALGPLCASSVLVTRHLKAGHDPIWDGFSSVSLLRAGVLGTVGVESAVQIRAFCEAVRPSLVLVVDALAGAEAAGLCRSIQICDSGISPGSGVRNDRARIDRALLGVPVTAIGVPTVTDACTRDGGPGDLFVTPRDIDSAVRACARFIAYGINLALHPGITVEDIDALIG